MKKDNARKKKVAAKKAEMKKRTAAAKKCEVISPELDQYYDRAFDQLNKVMLPYNVLGLFVVQFAYDIYSDMEKIGNDFQAKIREKLEEKGENSKAFKVQFADRKVLKELSEHIRGIKKDMYCMEKNALRVSTAEMDEDVYGRSDYLFELTEPLRKIIEMVIEPESMEDVEKRVKVAKAHLDKLQKQMDKNSKGILTIGELISRL